MSKWIFWLLPIAVIAYLCTSFYLSNDGPSTGAYYTESTIPRIVFDGVSIRGVRQPFTAATSTPCSIQNPLGATTTLMAYMAQITVGTSTAATIDVGTSTTAFATSTNLVTAFSVAANSQATIGWYPAGVNNSIVGPTEWVNVKTVGPTAYTYTGTCTAIFLKP